MSDLFYLVFILLCLNRKEKCLLFYMFEGQIPAQTSRKTWYNTSIKIAERKAQKFAIGLPMRKARQVHFI